MRRNKMSDSITLHPTLGVNPRLTFCQRCRGEANELLLLGNQDSVYTCEGCGQPHIGRPAKGRCVTCDSYAVKKTRTLDEHERLPASSPCDSCLKEIEEHRAVVAAGGIYIRCADCRAEGVIKSSSPLAAEVREAHGTAAPEPCGIEFTKEAGCPTCGRETAELVETDP